MASWSQHLELLKKFLKCEVWILEGHQGIGKTSTARGMLYVMMRKGWTVTVDPKIRADILYWDDLGKWFHKRRWNSKLGKEVARFLEVVRLQYFLVLGTAPRMEDLDISIRESGIAEIIHVITNGVAFWRDVINVTPIFDSNETWRFKYGERLSKLQKEDID